MADITDATFQTEVVDRSSTVPVVIDLWAEWCGPCKTLGPILEKVIGETQGLVELAKVDVESNPQVAAAFQVQSIPAVYAMKDGQIIDGFVGALPEADVVQFVQRLIDGSVSTTEAVEGDDEGADASAEDAATFSEPGDVPEPAPTLSAAEADAVVEELEALLVTVKGDDDARARYLELLEQLGADDPRTNTYRRRLATALF